MVYGKRRGSRRRCVHVYKHTFVCVEMKCVINCFMGVQTLGHFGYLHSWILLILAHCHLYAVQSVRAITPSPLKTIIKISILVGLKSLHEYIKCKLVITSIYNLILVSNLEALNLISISFRKGTIHPP